MRAEYDQDANAVYVYLADRPYAFGAELDQDRRIDYASDGTPIGVELLNVRLGVNLDELPERDAIARLLAEQHLPVYA